MLNGTTGNEIIVLLAQRGIEAFWEYPGFVSVPLPDGSMMNLADGGETLNIQHATNEGELIEDPAGMESSIPSDTTDAKAVAEFLIPWVTKAQEVSNG